MSTIWRDTGLSGDTGMIHCTSKTRPTGSKVELREPPSGLNGEIPPVFTNYLALAIAALKSIDSIRVFKVNCTSTFINTIHIEMICIIHRGIRAVTYG